MKDDDYGIICLCALRYCFGRRTYMPSLVMNYIKKNWKDFTEKDQNLFLKETTEILGQHRSGLPLYNLGDKNDVQTYRDFQKWMLHRKEN